MGSAMARAKKPVDLGELVDRAAAFVAAHGAVPRAEMRAFRPHLAELEPRLVARGLEVGATIRRPLESQLMALASEGFVAEKALDRRLFGASARDVKAAVAALVSKGALVRVVRESGVGLVTTDAALLSREEVRRLLARAAALQKLLRKAHAKRGKELGVLDADVRAHLASWLPEPSMDAGEELTREIARRVRGASVPTRVPDLLRALGVSPELGKRALLDGVARGLFDLEPESGMGRLTVDDAELCPPGPMGTRLSWIRAREHQGA